MQNMVCGDEKIIFKCRRCRHFLFSHNQISDSHGEMLFSNERPSKSCNPIASVFYLKEESIPSWLKNQVDEGNWTKGKLFCPTCKCRIGSFDFVSGSKCSCGIHVLPSLHVVSCKLDCERM
ncbi:E3 ubiquitin-protein ligase RNF180, partial [Stegodyphus mimosarum]